MSKFYLGLSLLAVGSTLFADYRGWTVGGFIPWSSTRMYGNGINHK